MICRILDQTLTSKLATKAKGVQQWEIIFSEIVASQQPKKVKQEASHWVFYMQWFTFVMKHKSGASNKVANALSQRSLLLTSMTIIAKGFDSFNDLYLGDHFFGSIWKDLINGQLGKYLLHDDFLFKGNKLCVPNCSLREKILQDMHGGGLGGYFRQGKTYTMIKQKFFWPKMRRDVYKLTKRC